MEKNALLLPGAIVVSGALIGAGLFLGLRGASSGTAPPASPPSAEPVTPAGSAAIPGAADAPVPPSAAPAGPVSAELQGKVRKQALEALEKHRAQIVKECWDPSFAKDPTPPKARFPLRFLFDSKGKAVVSGAGEPLEASRADVSQCIREMKLPISVPPPGTDISVQLELTLPR